MELYIAVAGIIFVLWFVYRKRHFSTFKNIGIPGPEPNIFFGNILELYRKGAVRCQTDWVKKYGRIVGYFYGIKPVLLVTDPEVLKDVFIKDFPKFINKELFCPIVDYDPHEKYLQTVVNLPGKMWKNARKILTPSFTSAKLKQAEITINCSIGTMVNIMKDHAKIGSVFDVMDLYERVSMDIITRTTLGLRTDVQTNLKSKLPKFGKVYFSMGYKDPFVMIGLSFPYLKWLSRKALLITQRILNEGEIPVVSLENIMKYVVDHRRKYSKEARCDTLQLMINSKIPIDAQKNDSKYPCNFHEENFSKENSSQLFRTMTDCEIISTSFSVFTAGYEPTRSALAFTTYLIAKHPDVQEKLYEEISSVVQKDENLKYDNVCQLQYLGKVLKESLRIYPPTILFSNRYAMEDVQYGHLKIPKGMLVQGPVYLLHHDSEFWKEPEKFNPERFNDKINVNGVTYMPFGVGPRNCLGMRFAMMEMMLVLAHVLYKFKITLADGQENLELFYNIRNISPKNGIWVKMELRNAKED